MQNGRERSEAVRALYVVQQELLRYTWASMEYERGQQNYGLREALGINMLFYPMDIHVLLEIQAQQGITLQELCRVFNRSKGYLSGRVKKLWENKLVVKVENPENYKVQNLYITELGRKAAELHEQADLDWCEGWLGRLPDYTAAELERISHMLHEAVDHLLQHKKRIEDEGEMVE